MRCTSTLTAAICASVLLCLLQEASTAPSVVPSSGDEASGASLRGGSDMHALELDVTLPYTSTQFDTTKKTAYKAAIKSAGGAKVDHVDIEKVTEIHDHRRQHDDDKVKVTTKIVAKTDADIDAVKTELGTGTALKTKINAALANQTLSAATAVTDPVEEKPSSASGVSNVRAIVFTAAIAAIVTAFPRV